MCNTFKHWKITTKCFGKIICFSLREALKLESTTLWFRLFSQIRFPRVHVFLSFWNFGPLIHSFASLESNQSFVETQMKRRYGRTIIMEDSL